MRYANKPGPPAHYSLKLRTIQGIRPSPMDAALPRIPNKRSRQAPELEPRPNIPDLRYRPNLPMSSATSRSSGIYPRPELSEADFIFKTPTKYDRDEEWSPKLSKTLHDHCRKKNKTESTASGSSSSSKMMRTPRTLTRLMQQHRDNERSRHRGLNASIKEITKFLPGYPESCNDTKIGKLQKIIHYICHLETHIQRLCEQVGLDLQFKNLFLSPHIKNLDEKPIGNPLGFSHSAGHAASVKKTETTTSVKYNTKARRKISSPTIDSTTQDVRSSTMCQEDDYSHIFQKNINSDDVSNDRQGLDPKTRDSYLTDEESSCKSDDVYLESLSFTGLEKLSCSKKKKVPTATLR